MISPRRLITDPVALLASALTHLAPIAHQLVRPGSKRSCAVCGDPVRDDDAFLRGGGEYYHAEPCLEDVLRQAAASSPHSERSRRGAAS